MLLRAAEAAFVVQVDVTTILAILGILLGGGGIGTVIVQNRGKKIKTPADENEATRLGNQFLRDMLADAKAEREELRESIKQLHEDGVAKQAALDRLEQILESKDSRIRELEERQEQNARKLQSGVALTLEDILGTSLRIVPPEEI